MWDFYGQSRVWPMLRTQGLPVCLLYLILLLMSRALQLPQALAPLYWKWMPQVVAPEIWLVLVLDGESFYCRAGWDLLGPLLQLVPVTGSLGSRGGEGAWWLVALVIPAMLARAGVDTGAPGEVQSPQAMFRLSSSTTQPTKCCFHAWKAPHFSCILWESYIEAHLW